MADLLAGSTIGGYPILHSGMQSLAITGNIAIGGTSPSAKLTINTLVGNTAAIFGAVNGVSIVANHPHIAFNAYFNGGWKTLTGGGYAAAIGMSPIDGTLTFYTLPSSPTAGTDIVTTNRMQITNSGDVLITGQLRVGTLSGDPQPVITARTVPSGQGNATERTELILFHSNDGDNGSGPDLITLRSPAIRLQTYTDSGVADISNNAGSNDRLTIDPSGKVRIITSFVIPVYTGSDPANLVAGEMWLRTDI